MVFLNCHLVLGKFIKVEKINEINILGKVKFMKNKITICFAINNEFFLYLLVTIQSILNNINTKYFYEIVIFYTDLNISYKRYLNGLKNLEHCSFRAIDLNEHFKDIDSSIFHEGERVTKETYYRFFIPKILNECDKVLYLDADILVLSDISYLFEQELSEQELAIACPDVAFLVDSNIRVSFNEKQMSSSEYFTNHLHMKNTKNYFNAGVILFDIKKCLKFNLEEKLLKKLKDLKHPLWRDQDILNSVLEGRVKLINFSWNYQQNISPNLSRLPSKYICSDENIKIWHFNGGRKPWDNIDAEKAEIWWSFAKQTTFYEKLLLELFFKYNKRANASVFIQKGAVERVKNHLSYKIGKTIIDAKNPIKFLFLPLSIAFLCISHIAQRKFYNFLIKLNPSFKMVPLEKYVDYKDVAYVKKHLSYMMGKAFVDNPLTFVFKIRKIYRQWKDEK